MRGTTWGNPYSVAEYGRDQALKLYCENVIAPKTDKELSEWLHPLLVKKIGCTCRLDQPCHGDILIAEIKRMNRLYYE